MPVFLQFAVDVVGERAANDVYTRAKVGGTAYYFEKCLVRDGYVLGRTVIWKLCVHPVNAELKTDTQSQNYDGPESSAHCNLKHMLIDKTQANYEKRNALTEDTTPTTDDTTVQNSQNGSYVIHQ